MWKNINNKINIYVLFDFYFIFCNLNCFLKYKYRIINCYNLGCFKFGMFILIVVFFLIRIFRRLLFIFLLMLFGFYMLERSIYYLFLFLFV